jgi:superfamily II DNA or RNA helicase
MHPSKRISCDYVYGLAEAIQDNVCRIPQIIAVDNNNISVIDDDETKTFTSFKCLLSQSIIPYQEIIENEKVIKYVISSAQKKLNSIRAKNSDAAGLIVASSVEHAKQISMLMKVCFKEDAVVVTYRENEPTSIIQQFRHAKTKWIISVGMISEGTNIPRLQVLGRTLRMTGSNNQEAVMYMPAEPKLLEYAYRVKQDVPFEADVVKFEKMTNHVEIEVAHAVTFNKTSEVISKAELELGNVINHPACEGIDKTIEEHLLTSSYEKVVNIFGQFQQESIALGLSELR